MLLIVKMYLDDFYIIIHIGECEEKMIWNRFRMPSKIQNNCTKRNLGSSHKIYGKGNHVVLTVVDDKVYVIKIKSDYMNMICLWNDANEIIQETIILFSWLS